MASTYSTLKIQLMATGENSTTWGTVTNTNLGTAIEEAITGSADVTFASANLTISLTDTNATQTARNLRLNLTGTTGGSTRTLTVPAIEKLYLINNGCADSVTVKNSTGTGITVPAGKTMWVYNDATNVVDAVTYLSSLTLGTALPVASGGTGATTAASARSNLGAAASGANTDITSLSPTSGLQVGAPTGGAQGAGTVNATGLFINGLAVGVGSGSVTSVNASGGTTGMTFSGGPITTSGSLTMGFRLEVANGGTGNTSYTNGQLLIGNTSTGGLTKAAITAGSGITVTNGAGTITIATSGGSGTVTSVNVDGSTTGLTFTGGPVTTTGTFTAGGTLAVANGGTGATTAATARSNLGLGTMATQGSSSVSITGGAITGITDLAVADGGTGASTAATARSNLSAAASGANSDITGLTGTSLGSVSAPSYSFTGDTNTGMYSTGADSLDFTTGGVLRFTVANSAVTSTVVHLNADGAVGAPAYSFSGDSDTGFYRSSSGVTTHTSNGAAGPAFSTGLSVPGQLTVTGNTGVSLVLPTSNPPATAASGGSVGRIEWDSGFIYVCVATSTWKRAALSTW